ncbi:MAG: hypothetical protein N4A47_02895 [Clostridia bacterium]|jgi:hypothetical protein|nr:hypothetical protein [Clostridia bacterium]
MCTLDTFKANDLDFSEPTDALRVGYLKEATGALREATLTVNVDDCDKFANVASAFEGVIIHAKDFFGCETPDESDFSKVSVTTLCLELCDVSNQLKAKSTSEELNNSIDDAVSTTRKHFSSTESQTINFSL